MEIAEIIKHKKTLEEMGEKNVTITLGGFTSKDSKGKRNTWILTNDKLVLIHNK